jgi:hypothetical protein
MAWETLSLHFKQQYDGAYRYLDRCGEFMLAAVEKMDFMPGDTKPEGAKLEIPENGFSAAVDTLESLNFKTSSKQIKFSSSDIFSDVSVQSLLEFGEVQGQGGGF